MKHSSWKEYRIEELSANTPNAIALGPFGSYLTRKDYVSNGIPVIRGGNLSKGRFNAEGFVFVTERKADALSSSNAYPDDIVITYRGTLGQVGIIPKFPFKRYVVSQSGLKLTFNSNRAYPLFMYYYFKSKGILELLRHRSGSGVPAISNPVTNVKRIKLLLPPLKTQKTIANIISYFDVQIENNTRRIEIIEGIVREIYREWFLRFRFPEYEETELVNSELGEIPIIWKIVELDSIVDINRGRSYRSTNLVEEGGYPFLNLKCFNRDGGFRKDGLKRYDGPFKETQTAESGDIIVALTDMTQDRAVVARAARVPEMNEPKFILSMDLVKITPHDRSTNDYIYSMLRYSRFPHEIKEKANGTNVLHLNPNYIKKYKFVLPPKELQRAFSEIISNHYHLQDVLSKQIDKLSQMRNLLLPRLVLGAIEVSESIGEIMTSEEHTTSKYDNKQSSLTQWLDGDEEDGSRK